MLQAIDAAAAERFGEELELAAAVLDLHLAPHNDTPLHEGLEANVLGAMARARDADAQPPAPPTNLAAARAGRERAPAGGGARAGWYAAAASFALALVLGVQLLRAPGDAPNTVTAELAPEPAQAYAALASREEGDIFRWDWQPPSAPGFEQVRGDVVWDNATQTGYMRLVNMPVNDPSSSQYQLWIVDPTRDEHPVDGGVFDIDARGEVIVPIDGKLAINAPAAFAITEEQPGGVVVSAGPLLVVAAPEQA
jgi:anti-sigma-K factor RskA